MAISPTDPPQVVQYRKVRVRIATQQMEILMEEHWVTELMTRYSQMSESIQRVNNDDVVLLACTAQSENQGAVEPVTPGAIMMNMVVSSAINGEYEPCG